MKTNDHLPAVHTLEQKESNYSNTHICREHTYMYACVASRSRQDVSCYWAGSTRGKYSNREKYDANHYTEMTFIHWPLRVAPKPAQRDEQIAQLISTK